MIKVTDRFYIDADSHCYSVKEKTIIQDKNSPNYGNPFFKDLGYYTSIESCIKGILKTFIREYINKDTENSLKDLQNEIKKLREYIENLKLDI